MGKNASVDDSITMADGRTTGVVLAVVETIEYVNDYDMPTSRRALAQDYWLNGISQIERAKVMSAVAKGRMSAEQWYAAVTGYVADNLLDYAVTAGNVLSASPRVTPVDKAVKQPARDASVPQVEPQAARERPTPSFKEQVLRVAYDGKGIERVQSDGFLAATVKKTGRGIFIVPGTLNRAVYHDILAEATTAEINTDRVHIFAERATYTGHGIDVTKFDNLPPLRQANTSESAAVRRFKP